MILLFRAVEDFDRSLRDAVMDSKESEYVCASLAQGGAKQPSSINA